MEFRVNFDDINIDELEVAELKKLAEEMQNPPKEGWTFSSGKSPLRIQLQIVKRLMEMTKEEYEKEHVRQLKKLEVMMRSRANNAKGHTVRVKKNGNKR